jgi:hypothetical protein
VKNMIDSILIYQKERGSILWRKEFQNEKRLDLQDSSQPYISMIEMYIKELATKNISSTDNLDLGEKTLFFHVIPQFSITIVFLTNREDKTRLLKIYDKVTAILNKNSILFANWSTWNGDVSVFEILSFDLNRIIVEYNSAKPFLIPELTPNQALYELEAEHTKKLKEQSVVLENKLKNTTIFSIKLEILDQLLKYGQELNDNTSIDQYKKVLEKIQKEFQETKFKAQYFLTILKKLAKNILDFYGQKSVTEINYRDIYLNAFSLASKLKLLGKDQMNEKLKMLATELLEKKEMNKEFYTEILTQFMNLPENVI